MDCASLTNFFTQGSVFGCRYLLFECLSKFSILNVLVLVFIWGIRFKFLHFGWYTKLSILLLHEFRKKFRGWFCLSGQKSEVCEEKIETSVLETVGSQDRESPIPGKQSENNWNVDCKEAKDVQVEEKIGDISEGEELDEDKEFDVKKLRKMVKAQRKRANAAYTELDKERMAAASAAEEAMGMILRLQNEKSALEIQANHDHLLAEQKQAFDEATIQTLQWIINEQECEKGLLEDQLRLCKQKLQQYVKEDAMNNFEDMGGYGHI